MNEINFEIIKYEISSSLRKSIPDINNIWLFGSRARGDNKPDSDFDIFFTVNGKQPLFQYDQQARLALYPLTLSYNIPFDVFSAYNKNFQQCDNETSPIYDTIKTEGVLI